MFRGIRRIAADIAAYRWWYLVFGIFGGVIARIATSDWRIIVAAAMLVPLMISFVVTMHDARDSKAPSVSLGWWTITKFVMLFAIIAGFVSYNFGVVAGLPVAVAITALAVAQRKIFDAATDALLDVRKEDNGAEKVKKTATVAIVRFLYSLQDYGLAALSVALVIAAREYGYSYMMAIVVMWVLIDLPVTAAYVMLYEKTGRDLTLGRAYRRMVDAIFTQSQLAGMIAMTYEVTLASFWSGPDYTVLFFRDELKTRMRMTVAIIGITAIHAVLWTTVYWFGYDNILELWEHIRQ